VAAGLLVYGRHRKTAGLAKKAQEQFGQEKLTQP